MKLEEALKSLDLKFTSGNDVQVERNTITRDEWEPIKKAVVNYLDSFTAKKEGP